MSNIQLKVFFNIQILILFWNYMHFRCLITCINGWCLLSFAFSQISMRSKQIPIYLFQPKDNEKKRDGDRMRERERERECIVLQDFYFFSWKQSTFFSIKFSLKWNRRVYFRSVSYLQKWLSIISLWMSYAFSFTALWTTQVLPPQINIFRNKAWKA